MGGVSRPAPGVIPAQAGISRFWPNARPAETPACAGVTIYSETHTTDLP
ncbi:hypothetical protein SAMN03159340_01535 [Sphingomonas sp. NFR15]|nr:hypothetical protein SAMN03159340_01535 [Sphingomonas sp. NFR15]